jgi:IS30 family transposase
MPAKRKTISRSAKRAPERRRASKRRQTTRIATVDVQELDSIRAELERLATKAAPPRWNADPEEVRRSVAKLVLTLVEFIRQLLERQAIRRMDAGTLTPEQTEAVGLALMRLEETVRDIGAQFGLELTDLNLDLGPVGKLM